jgi:hypothetical protein
VDAVDRFLRKYSGSSTADDVIHYVIGVLFEFHVGWHVLVVRDVRCLNGN